MLYFLQGRSCKCAYRVIVAITMISSYASVMNHVMIQSDCLIVWYTKKGCAYGLLICIRYTQPETLRQYGRGNMSDHPAPNG
jgi:hypothetical protein